MESISQTIGTVVGIIILISAVLLVNKYTNGMFRNPKEALISTVVIIVVLAIVTLMVFDIMSFL